MKLLESLRIRARSSLRARLPLGERPSRLDLRLDGFDGPGNVPAPTLDVDAWQERVAEFVMWAGPMPARIIGEASHPGLPDLVRFCHRLEMPTTVRTGPAGLTEDRATELLDRGMATCELVVAGLDDEAESAARALVHARHVRAGQLSVRLHVAGVSAPSAQAVAQARALGVDVVVASPPWLGPDGLPGARREGGHCPVAQRRVLLLPDGTVTSCPYKPGAARVLPPDLSAHRQAVRACDRACTHRELD